jgi:hypothetical protein
MNGYGLSWFLSLSPEELSDITFLTIPDLNTVDHRLSGSFLKILWADY